MKILIINHYLNFKETYNNKFPKIFLEKLKKENIDYEILDHFKKDEFFEKIKSCDFILNFEELVTKNSIKFYENTSSTLNDLLITFKDLEKKIPIYPSFDFYNLTASKTYLNVLSKNLVLPYTKTFTFKINKKEKMEHKFNKIKNKYLKKGIKNIVVKFGYSGDSDHVFFYDVKDILNVLPECSKYYKDIGKNFLIIVQPFNSIVRNRLNEYRTLFIDGKMSSIAAFGYTRNEEGKRILIPSKELDENDKIDKKIIKYANMAYKQIEEKIGYVLPFLRVDVSWAEDDIFISKKNKEKGKKRRYYINEIENLDGTFYFMLPYVPKKYDRLYKVDDCDNTICQKSLGQQEDLANSLLKYIKEKTKIK